MSASFPKHAWCCLIAPAVLASVLVAQVVAPSSPNAGYGPPPYYGYGGMGYGSGFGWGGGGYGAGSTVAGSYLSGLGQAVRAQGQYNLMTSEAAINLEEAQKKDMDNQLQWTNTYFEMRKINQTSRFPKKENSRSQADWVRIAHDSAPRRLDSSVLDPVTGKIQWPLALTAENFSNERQTLDQLFAQRAASQGAVGLSNYEKIRATVNEAQTALKSQVRQLDPQTYIQAKNFLASLAREADFPSS